MIYNLIACVINNTPFYYFTKNFFVKYVKHNSNYNTAAYIKYDKEKSYLIYLSVMEKIFQRIKTIIEKITFINSFMIIKVSKNLYYNHYSKVKILTLSFLVI